jgi:hypothetical protein
MRNRDGSVGIPTSHGWTAGVRFPAIFLNCVRSGFGPTHLPLQWLPGPLSPGEKLPGFEAYHTSSARSRVMELQVPSLISFHCVAFH